MPSWAWLLLALGSWVCGGLWHVVGGLARTKHAFTCRVFWQVKMIFSVTEEIAWVVLLWGGWFGYVYVGLLTVVEAQCVWRALHRCRCAPRSVVTVHSAGVVVHSYVFHTAFDVCMETWHHRTHDDDCEAGPTKKWFGAKAKLRGWDKVALNPDFAPV